MDITIYPKRLSGAVQVIPSKSQAHRLLICAAFADKPTELICRETNRDIEATADCLTALGARIVRTDTGYQVFPVASVPKEATLNCGESGSTLRFMLPIVGALGVNAKFLLEGRLPNRPLSPLKEEMERMGCRVFFHDKSTLCCTGKLRAGNYHIDGSVSSQFITGLLFALVLLDSETTLEITGNVESKPYIDLTKQALHLFQAKVDGNRIHPSLPLTSPGIVEVEGDWSNGAFFLGANALGSSLKISGLSDESTQGDRICKDIFTKSEHFQLSCKDFPDLVPILAVFVAANKGAVFTDIARLRLKESDRVQSVCNMLSALGVEAYADDNTLTVKCGKFCGCTIDAVNDHRIAMAAAIAATIADGPVTILGAHCVSKSYPAFWDIYENLGGHYEQYLR